MCRKYISLALLVLFTKIAVPQSSITDYYDVYDASGKLVSGEFKTINEMITKFNGHPSKSNYTNDHKEATYFRELSSVLLFVMLDKGMPFKGIPYYKAKYNYKKYINSYSYYFDLQDLIKKGELTDSYLKTVFGQPSKTEVVGQYNVSVYNKNNLKVYSNSDGQIFYADPQNYSAFQTNGIAIREYNVTGDDYSIGFELSIENFAKKTIKYISFTVKALNAVDDQVGIKTVRGVGPIKPGDVGAYEFSNLIYSRSADRLKIITVKVQYMDGSVKVIPSSQINEIIETDWEAEGEATI